MAGDGPEANSQRQLNDLRGKIHHQTHNCWPETANLKTYSPHSLSSSLVSGPKASSGMAKRGEVGWPTFGRDGRLGVEGTILATGCFPRHTITSSPDSTR